MLWVFGPVLCNIFFRRHIFQLYFSLNCFIENLVDTFCIIFKIFAHRSNLFLIDKQFCLISFFNILLFCDNGGINESSCCLKVAFCFVNKAHIGTKNDCFYIHEIYMQKQSLRSVPNFLVKMVAKQLWNRYFFVNLQKEMFSRDSVTILHSDYSLKYKKTLRIVFWIWQRCSLFDNRSPCTSRIFNSHQCREGHSKEPGNSFK